MFQMVVQKRKPERTIGKPEGTGTPEWTDTSEGTGTPEWIGTSEGTGIPEGNGTSC